jgi:hypothetical protein
MRNHIKRSCPRDMSVDWLVLKNQLHAYLRQTTLEQKLKEKMTYLQNLMEGGIRDVQDESQLKKWINQMFNKSNEIFLLLDITPNTTTTFMYQYQTLSVKDVVENIRDKIESMNATYRMVNIERLKREFVFAEPESVLDDLDGFQYSPGPDTANASLAQLLVALQKLNESI